MTAHLFYVDPGLLDDGRPGSTVTLTGAEARHAGGAMRLGPGDPILVADTAGRRARGTVAAADRDAVTVTVEQVEDVPAPRPELVLVQALAKGDRDTLAVQTATELGVDAVVPWESERAIVRWRGPKEAKARQKWADALHAAAKQARRARIPVLEPTLTGATVSGLVQEGAVVVVLHEDAAQPLSAADAADWADAERIVLVVGPEGGISAGELEALTLAGAQLRLLGPNVLRSSTAGPAALAVLQHLLGRW